MPRSDFLAGSTFEEMASRQPHVSWTEIPDAGHYVHDDYRPGYLAALRSFLGQHSGEA